MNRSPAQPIPISSPSPHKALPRQLPKLPHEPSSMSSASGTNGVSRSSLVDTPTHAPRQGSPKILPSLQRLGSSSSLCPSRSLRVVDTRTNKSIEGAPPKWKGSGKQNPPPKSLEAKALAQSYQQFISLKILLGESRRYAWENIVLRHPEAISDEVLVYQFNSTWGQLMDDTTTAIVERQVANVSAAASVINMMELFQRHSPAVDLLPDTTPPIGPRHLPIDWYEAQRQEVRVAVVEERQARKGRAVSRALTPAPIRKAR